MRPRPTPPSRPTHRRVRGASAIVATAIVATLTLLLACADADSPRAPAARAPATTARRVVPAPWQTLWRRGGGEDTLLLMPVAVAADSARVYVLDAAGYRVVAFDGTSGRLAWLSGRKGGGPGEFSGPVALVPSRGGVVVADPGNARITSLDASGLVVQEITLPDASTARSLCPLAGGALLVATGEDRPLALLAPDGRVERRLPLPWKALAALPPLARQLRLAPTTDGEGCVVALELGHGFAVLSKGRIAVRRPYVESFPLPHVRVERSWRTRTQRLTERRIAAYDVTVVGDEITMAFEGRTRGARHLLDLYSASSGAYLRSYRLETPVNGIARVRDRVYVLSERDGYPTLTAFGTGTAPGAP